MGKVIYEPKGKAGEYAHLALNLYSGCGHRCKYCYVPGVLREPKWSWFKREPRPRKDIILGIDKDALKLSGTDKRVLLSFTSDPYQPIEETEKITRDALFVLKEYGIPFTVLTKAGKLATRDFDLYTSDDQFAVSLVVATEMWAKAWEPGAPTAAERIDALREAKRQGISTWVSIEPVLSPVQSLQLIQAAAPWTDLFKIGKWNHDRRAHSIHWREFGRRAIRLCEQFEVPYYIKADLAKHLDGIKYTNTDNRRIP